MSRRLRVVVLLALSAAPGAAGARSAPRQPVRAFPGCRLQGGTDPGHARAGARGVLREDPGPAAASRRTRSRRAPATTIYEQYGYAGLRWHTYDLGCGPDAARNPDAVIGTALSNWIMQHPDLAGRADRPRSPRSRSTRPS